MKNIFLHSYHLFLGLLLVCAFACHPENKSASAEKTTEKKPATEVVSDAPKTAFINPPLPELQPAFIKSKVRAEKGGKISFPGKRIFG